MKKHQLIASCLTLLLLPMLARPNAYINQKEEPNKPLTETSSPYIHHRIVKQKPGAKAGYNEQITKSVKLGGEVDVDDLSGFDFDDVFNFKDLGLDLLATASFSVTEKVDLFAKAGVTNLDHSDKAHSSLDKKTMRADPKLVLGSSYNISEKLSVTGKVTHVFDDKQEMSNPFLDKRGSSSTGGSIGLKLKW